MAARNVWIRRIRDDHAAFRELPDSVQQVLLLARTNVAVIQPFGIGTGMCAAREVFSTAQHTAGVVPTAMVTTRCNLVNDENNCDPSSIMGILSASLPQIRNGVTEAQTDAQGRITTDPFCLAALRYVNGYVASVNDRPKLDTATRNPKATETLHVENPLRPPHARTCRFPPHFHD